ncbi:MAG: Ig-like domain-containing protein [Candidatus Neomarinimicrobiota bacterium]|tara:strand:- start:11999 stop:14320 length:2322 start_codon:yes stop_codon:yes gene_type:complete
MTRKNIYFYISFMLLLSCEGPFFDVPADEDSIPPTLTITFPADQSVLSDSVLISAYAFDNVGLDLVTIYLNDSIVHESMEGPFEYLWSTYNNEEDEFHTIRAKATDMAGNVNYTNTLQVLVDNQDNQSPTGALIFPFTGQTLKGEITIIIEASDNDQVETVDLYIDGDSIATYQEPPYRYDWNTLNEIDDVIYTIHAHVRDNAGNQITIGPINVTIDNYESDDEIAPTGTIISPASASTVSGTINIEVYAYDNIRMGHVDFIIDGSEVAHDSIPPYSYSWNTLGEAEDSDHVININLSDSAGNTTSLFPVTVFVDNIEDADITPPSIVIYDPAANQTVSGTVTFMTIATDNVAIDRVEFYHDYELEFTATNYPYNYEWNSTLIAEDSEHVWHAKAFDTSGNDSQTQPMVLFVDNIDNIPPTGFILYPYAGQIVSDNIEIQVSASDNVGIAEVEFYLDGNLLSSDDQVPYAHEWNTNSSSEDEEHVIYATIIDLQGNSTDLSPISVTVNNDDAPSNDLTPPIATILTPLSTQTVSDTVIITGFASDNHEIEQVIFYVNDQLIDTVTDSPYTTNWITYEEANNSEHVIQMTAQDLSGNQSSAQPVLVTVINEYTGEINNLTLLATENTISLSWDAPNDAESYKVYKNGSFLTETNEQFFNDVVVPGTEFCYTVSAVNIVNLEGPQSTEVCETSLYPPSPTLSLSIDGSLANLTWTSVSTAVSYRLYQDDVFIIELAVLNHTLDIGIGSNTCFKVTSVNSIGTESLVSNEECGEGS